MTHQNLFIFFFSHRYPVGMTLIQTLFSKILGARPQGTWTGWMVASGSMGRIIGMKKRSINV
jgi:MFS transporter, ceroid-lipofuscinosis neuronal protein 7